MNNKKGNGNQLKYESDQELGCQADADGRNFLAGCFDT